MDSSEYTYLREEIAHHVQQLQHETGQKRTYSDTRELIPTPGFGIKYSHHLKEVQEKQLRIVRNSLDRKRIFYILFYPLMTQESQRGNKVSNLRRLSMHVTRTRDMRRHPLLYAQHED